MTQPPLHSSLWGRELAVRGYEYFISTNAASGFDPAAQPWLLELRKGEKPREDVFIGGIWLFAHSVALIYSNNFRRRGSKATDRPESTSHPDSKAHPTSAADLKTPERFHDFLKLPYEIRQQIWKIVAEERRTVVVKANLPGNHSIRLSSSSPPPAMLHVCAESREVALKYYTLAFGRHGHPAQIYFNFDRDILFLFPGRDDSPPGQRVWPMSPTDPDIKGTIDYSDKKRVRNLGFGLNCVNNSVALNWSVLKTWPALETLYLGLLDSKLNMKSQILCRPLPTKDYRLFSKAFFDRSWGSRAPAGIWTAPWTPIPARIEGIRTECIHGYGLYFSPKERSRYNKIRDAVCLVKLTNL